MVTIVMVGHERVSPGGRLYGPGHDDGRRDNSSDRL
jgi:hypothetical protein